MTDSTKTDLKQVTASRRQAMDPALSDDLLERVLTPENLRKAWHQVKANHGAPGVDGMTIEDFPAFAREHWPHSPSVKSRDVPTGPGPAHGDTQAPRTRAVLIRDSLCRRARDSTGDGASSGYRSSPPGCSASSFGFRPSRSAPSGRQADPELHQTWLQGRRGLGLSEILRPGEPRRFDGAGGAKGS